MQQRMNTEGGRGTVPLAAFFAQIEAGFDASQSSTDICPNCGKEWPARFGWHNCKMHRQYVHNNAIVLEPGANLLESIQRLAARFEGEATRRAEYASSGGDESPYPTALGEIDAVIGFLKRFRADIQALSVHQHKWDSNDYCVFCGADGRA